MTEQRGIQAMIKKAFLTKTFYEKYPNSTVFLDMWNVSPFKINTITNEEITEIYNHLVTEYMMSHFKFIEQLQIDLQVAHLIHNYYPNVKKRLELQKQMLTLTDEELAQGGLLIQSDMVNPDTDEITPLGDDLPFTSKKSIQTKKHSKLDRIARQYSLIIDGIYDTFITRFKDLFITLVIGTDNLLTMDNEDWNADTLNDN